MKAFFKYVFAGMIGTILALVLVAIIGIVILVGVISSTEETVEVKPNSILKINFDDKIGERSGTEMNFLDFNVEKQLGISDITSDIEKAAADKNIKGIFIELGYVDAGIATVEEIRNALIKFKESKKFIIAHSDYFTHKTYYLASVADKIYLTPEGELQFIGLNANIVLFKSMLNKIGVEPEIIRHGKFKSAVEPFMLDQISDENREQTSKYVNSIWSSILNGISKYRKISVENLNKYADELAVSSANKAFELKFVDGLLYKDQVLDELKKLSGLKENQKIEFIKLNKYNTAANKPDFEKEKSYSKNKIAVVYANGDIVTGEGSKESIGSDKLSETLRKLRQDSTVKAIVLRINSPGGSALASEVIWRETVLAKKEKPLVVSMGDLAASGGYYIACAADKIVAQPNTLTGSIGVFGLLFNASELMKNVGISVSSVNTNEYSDLASPSRKMTDYEKNVIQNSVEDIYSVFIKHVAEGRNLSAEKVDEIGQGRVWSGTDAKNLGLADELGGLEDAVKIAAKLAKLENYKIYEYPKKDKYEEIFDNFFAETKAYFIQNELGATFPFYKNLKQLSDIKGIQARMPYFIEIE